MMELIKQKLISFLLVIMLLFSCSQASKSNKVKILETLLDTYICINTSFSQKSDCIVISQVNLDQHDFARISIRELERKEVNNKRDLYQSVFNGITLYLQYGEVKSNNIIISLDLDDNVISNKLNWKLIKAGTMYNSSMQPSVYDEYYETYLLYSINNKCIKRNSILCTPQLKDSLINKCSAWMCD